MTHPNSRRGRTTSTLLAILAITISFVVPAAAPAAAAVPGRPIGPVRLDDPHGDGTYNGDVLQLQVAGRGGIPANAAAVAITVTVTNPQTSGYITAWPCMQPAPNASVVNYAAGQTVPNLVLVKPGARGKVCIRASGEAHVLADAAGYFPAGTAFRPSTRPTRVHDSRDTVQLVPGQARAVRVTGVAGVPSGAPGVAVNLTAVAPSAAGYLRAYTCGQGVPNASALNFAPGQTIANLALLRPSASGYICIVSSRATHLLVDSFGYFASSAGFTTTAPSRLLDTRIGQGGSRLPAGSTLQLTVSPSTASAVALNVTALDGAGNGYLTLWPCGAARPNASNVNFSPGKAAANLVLVRPGAGSKVCIYTSSTVDLLADRFGYVPSQAGFVAPTPSRLLDTRLGAGMPSYDFLYENSYNQYARWNACSGTTIRYRLSNHLGMPADKLDAIRAGFATLSQGTGFTFTESGPPLTQKPDLVNNYAEFYGADVIAGYATDEFDHPVIGVGGFYNDDNYEIFEGFLWVAPDLDAADTEDVILHELGHMVGLNHTDDSTQLMYWQLIQTHGQFEAGDWEGLKMVGRDMPCIPALRRPVDRDNATLVTWSDTGG